MAFTSYGYDGAITEGPWSLMSYLAGPAAYNIGNSVSNFRVTAVANADRTVSVATGTAFGMGVVDTSDSVVTKQHDTQATGVRYDLVVLRRDWATNTTSVEIVKGTSTQDGAFGLRNATRGVVDDQPLALVRIAAGVQTAAIEADLRVWGYNGGLYAKSALVTWYLNAIGSKVRVQDLVYQLGLDGSDGLKWYIEDQKPFRRGWIGTRDSADLFGVGAVGNAASVTIVNAPAGAYILGGRAELAPQGTVDTEHTVTAFFRANAIYPVASRSFGTSMGAGRYRTLTAPPTPYYHPGGDLTVSYQMTCSVSCGVRRSEVTVNYLGPAAG